MAVKSLGNIFCLAHVSLMSLMLNMEINTDLLLQLTCQ